MSLTGHFYTCSDKILCGLGRMYVGGGELTENIDDVGGRKSHFGEGLWNGPSRTLKLIRKNILLIHSRYVRYQDVTEPEKILQPDDFD